MMEIQVLYFAALREAKNQSKAQVRCNADETAKDIAQRLVGRTDCLVYAVNDEVVSSDYRLKDGDTLALIPPMAGG